MVVLLAFAAATAAPPITGVWELCDRGRAYMEDTDPRGAPNTKWWFGADGVLTLAAPDFDGHGETKREPWRSSGEGFQVGDGDAAVRFDIARRDARSMVIASNGLQSRLCRLGDDRMAFERPIAPHSVQTVIAREGEAQGELPPQVERGDAPASGVEGVWELVRVTTDAPMSEMPPYGLTNDIVTIADGQACFLRRGGEDEDGERPPVCRSADYAGHAQRDADFRASRDGWGYVVLDDGSTRFQARWLQARGRPTAALPLRVILLESAR